MSIIFYNDIKKGNERDEALLKLRQFLDKNEPGLVTWLHSLWNNQGKAITYKELREAILNGSLDPDILYEWQQDYAKFVAAVMVPAWTYALKEASAPVSQKYTAFTLNLAEEGVENWIKTKAASFVTNCTQEQIRAINAVVSRAAYMNKLSVDGLARAIRPMVGLTRQQAAANLRYYNKLIEGGLSEKKALERSIMYSARQHRYRGYNIARTELAYAYNKGQDFTVQQAIENKYMGTVKKVWCTADDERTCDICGALEGKTIEMMDSFDFQTKLAASNPGIKRTPPAHPSCRCTVLYIEVAPPDYSGMNIPIV